MMDDATHQAQEHTLSARLAAQKQAVTDGFAASDKALAAEEARQAQCFEDINRQRALLRAIADDERTAVGMLTAFDMTLALMALANPRQAERVD